MIKADVVIAEQRQIVDVPVETKPEAIRVLWDTYGLSIDIKGWVDDDEEVKDEQVDSNESDDSNELDGEGGEPQGDILQTNE